jgi:hypothetical protein
MALPYAGLVDIAIEAVNTIIQLRDLPPHPAIWEFYDIVDAYHAYKQEHDDGDVAHTQAGMESQMRSWLQRLTGIISSVSYLEQVDDEGSTGTLDASTGTSDPADAGVESSDDDLEDPQAYGSGSALPITDVLSVVPAFDDNNAYLLVRFKKKDYMISKFGPTGIDGDLHVWVRRNDRYRSVRTVVGKGRFLHMLQHVRGRPLPASYKRSQ